MPRMKSVPCRNCEVPIYLDFIRDGERAAGTGSGTGTGPIGGRIADWDWVHVGWEDGAGCRKAEPRPGRPVTDLPGL